MEIHYYQGFVNSFYNILRVLEMPVGSFEEFNLEAEEDILAFARFTSTAKPGRGLLYPFSHQLILCDYGYYWFCLFTDNP